MKHTLYWARSFVLNTASRMTKQTFLVWAAKQDLHRHAHQMNAVEMLKGIKDKIAADKELDTKDFNLLCDLIAASVAEKALDALEYSGQAENDEPYLGEKLLPYSYEDED